MYNVPKNSKPDFSSKLNHGHINEIYQDISLFKYLVFRDCLKSGYNNSSSINEILKEEIMIFDFPFDIPTYTYIDSLSDNIRNTIIEDSLYLKQTWLVTNPDFKDMSGKRVIAHCLDYFISSELDSIAKSRISK